MEKLSANTNALNWFEIPVADTVRAKKFYETILDIRLQTQEITGREISFFPFDLQAKTGKVSGALVKADGQQPSMDGAVVYLNANPSIQTVLDKIEKAGGKILLPKTLINDDIGYKAYFADTEGNRVALHAGK